jgi:SH3-like domain-containing protein
VKGLGPWLGAACAVTLLLSSLARAESATTKDRARLRSGPSAATDLLGEVDAGERVEIIGESGGWRQVRTADGRVAYLWGEHLQPKEGEPRAPAEGQGGPPRSLADQMREVRDDVAALRQRPEPATAADLERVRQELDRLAAAERDLARRFDDRFIPGQASGDPPPESTGVFAPALLLTGAIVGFAASRVMQRRRDHRQRSRLRL